MSNQEKAIKVPLQWDHPENVISRYANNLVVQHNKDSFFLSFYEARPPIISGSPEEREQKTLDLKSVKAECVARIVVPAERMEEFVRVLQDNIQRREEHEEILE